MEAKPDAEATEEYMLDYMHNGKRLQSLYWMRPDNRELALRAAAATARSDGVTQLRVFQRPKTHWEDVHWQDHVCPECGKEKGHDRFCPNNERDAR